MQKINKTDLIQKLESVTPGITKEELLQQNDCFVFKDGRIYTFNDEIAASVNTELEIEGAIQAELFLKVLYKIKQDEIEIGTQKDEIIIKRKSKGKGAETRIKFDEEIALPFDVVTLPKKFNKAPDNFIEQAKLSCLTASTDQNDALLSSIHLNGDEIESCDNDRITICKLNSSTKIKAIIPAKPLINIFSKLNNIKGIIADINWIHFKTENNTIISCCLGQETEYMDLKSRIPKEKGTKIILPEEISGIINRANIFSKNIDGTDGVIEIQLKNGKLRIKSANEFGKHSEFSKTNYKGPDIAFSINPNFLKDMISLSKEVSIINDLLIFSDSTSIHIIIIEI